MKFAFWVVLAVCIFAIIKIAEYRDKKNPAPPSSYVEGVEYPEE